MSDKPSTHLRLVTGKPGAGYHAEADAVLDGCKGRMVDVVIVGRDTQGHFVLAHTGDVADSVYLLALGQHTILSDSD